MAKKKRGAVTAKKKSGAVMTKKKSGAVMAKKWISLLQQRLEKVRAEGEPFGACMLPDPNGGPPICARMDAGTCKNLGGTFVGGDCG